MLENFGVTEENWLEGAKQGPFLRGFGNAALYRAGLWLRWRVTPI